MFKSISEFFSKEIDRSADGRHDDSQRSRIAACALLLELAWADDEFTDQEREAVSTVLREALGVDADNVTDLIRQASEQRRESTDLYRFTALIREKSSKPEVLDIVAAMWRVVYSDGRLEAHEDAMMHKIGHLLGLDHRELIATKLQARDSD